MRPTLKDQKLQNEFDATGYVVVDLFKPSEIAELKRIISKPEVEKAESGFNIETSYKLSFFSDSPAYRKKVFELIGSYCQPFVDRFLDNYEPLIVNTFDKKPGEGEVPIHQNWTFVDESNATSVSVWIPMIDTTRINGTMEVVKGSHEFLSKFRSPSIPWAFENLRGIIRDEFMQPINTEVGQAVILDDSILHYTSVNNSNEIRTAVQLIMKPKEAAALHYYKHANSNRVDVYEVDSEFFTKFKMNEVPDAPKMGELILSQELLSESQFRKLAADYASETPS